MSLIRGALLAVAVLVGTCVPAQASTPCHASSQADVSLGYPNHPPLGTGLACSPAVFCQDPNGCTDNVKLVISGDGIVGGLIEGPFGWVSCGPAPTMCSVTTPEFSVPFEGAAVRCYSGGTVAINVELGCAPSGTG